MATSGIEVKDPKAVEAVKQFNARKLRAFVLKFEASTTKQWSPSKVILDSTLEATKGDITEENHIWNELTFSDEDPAYYVCWFRRGGMGDSENANADDVAVLLWWTSDEMNIKRKMLTSSTLGAVKKFLTKNNLGSIYECRIGGKDELKSKHVFKAILDKKKGFDQNLSVFEGAPICELKKK